MHSAFSVDHSAEQIAVARLALRQALHALTPVQLLILQLRFDCDLPQATVAERLNVTQGWVSVLERKALETVRAFLTEE